MTPKPFAPKGLQFILAVLAAAVLGAALAAFFFVRVLSERAAHPVSSPLGIGSSAQDSELAFLRARLWEEEGRLAEADSVYRTLAQVHPDRREYLDARVTLGIKHSRGSPESGSRTAAVFAVSLLEPLARKHPRNAPMWLALGKAYLHRGLNASAAAALDSAMRLDTALTEARSLRDAAYRAWKGGVNPATDSDGIRPMELAMAIARDPAWPIIPDSTQSGQAVIPGAIGLLGAYTVPWGATAPEVLKAYPAKRFTTLSSGNLREAIVHDGLRHEQILAFKKGELWGVFVVVGDSANTARDVLGNVLHLKSRISGEGRGTGMTACPGWKKFQGVIWENEDTFEFLAHFEGQVNQVRLARVSIGSLPADRRVCKLARFLDPKTWK